MSDSWLRSGAIVVVSVAVIFAVACGGGGGGGGGGGAVEEPPVETAFLNGNVSYVSGALGKPMGKPGGKTVYRLSEAPADDYVGVPNATVRIYAIADEDFSDPLAQTTTDDTGAYTLTDGDLLPTEADPEVMHTMDEITGKPVIVRAYFTSYLSNAAGQSIAINNLVDMQKVAEAEAAGEEYTASIDPITTAVLQKVINVFRDLGLTLNQEQYASLEAVVSSVVQTAIAEASASETAFTLDEQYLVADDPDLDTSAVGDFLESEVIDGAVSGLETEASESSTDPVKVVNKFINWLGTMGFFVGDGTGGIYLRVPRYVTDWDGNEIDVIATLVATANSGVTLPAADVGFTTDTIIVNLNELFALDTDLVGDPMSIMDLALVDGDDTVWPFTFTTAADEQVAHCIKVVWQKIEKDSKAIMSRALINELVINRKNERISIEEIAIAISGLFQWWTEDTLSVDGYVQYMGERLMDVTKDGAGPTVQVSTVLGLLTGAIAETAYDEALEIASSMQTIFDVAEDVFMDITFQEWNAYVEAYDTDGDGIVDDPLAPWFDPWEFLFSHITSADDVANIVMGDYDLDGDGAEELVGFDGTTLLSKSDVFGKVVEQIKKQLLSSIPSTWFGATITKDTLCNFKTAMLMVMKVVDGEYLKDKTLGYMRTVTGSDGETWVEPRWDNFKWMQPTNDVENAVVANGVDPVLKAFFEALFDGVDPDGEAYLAADDATPLTALEVGSAFGAALDPDTLWQVGSLPLWWMDEFHGGMDMAGETGQGGLTNAHVTFQAVRYDGTMFQADNITAIEVYDDGGTYLFDADFDVATGLVTTEAVLPAGLATMQDYQFHFTFDPAIRSDTVDFWVWVSDFLPDEKPIGAPDGIGEMDMTRWGEVFWMPPPGGFQDYPWCSLMPDEGWYDGTTFVKSGLRLAGFEEGMMYVDENMTPSYDMRLETTTSWTLTFHTDVDATLLPDTYLGLWSLTGVDIAGITGGTDVSTTGVGPLTEANFDGTTGVTQYTNRLIKVVDPDGKKFVVELVWMSWDGWLDARFGKIDSYGNLVAPSGSGFTPGPPPGGGGMAWLLSGDFYNLETGEWAPPVFDVDSWAADARARATICYNYQVNVLFPTMADSEAATQTDVDAFDEQKLYAANGAAEFVQLDQALELDTDGDNMIDDGVDFTSFFGAGATSITVFNGQLIGIKTTEDPADPQYFLVRVSSVCQAEWWAEGDFYPGEVGLDYAGDMDGDDVPDFIPSGDMGGPGGDIPADKAGTDTLLDNNHYDFEDPAAPTMVADWTAGDLVYTNTGTPELTPGLTAQEEEWWWTWSDVNPMWVDHSGIMPQTPVSLQEGYFYSVLTSDGNILVLLVTGIDVVDPPSVDVEWRLYKRQVVDIATVFPDIAGRVGEVKTFSFEKYDGTETTYYDRTRTCEAAATLKDGVTMSTAIRCDTDPPSPEVSRQFIGYNGMGDLVIYGLEETDGTDYSYVLYNPPLVASWPMVTPGQFIETNMSTGTYYDAGGSPTGETVGVDCWSEIYGIEDVTVPADTYADCLVVWVTYFFDNGDYSDEMWYLAPGVGIVVIDKYTDGYDELGDYWYEWEYGELEP